MKKASFASFLTSSLLKSSKNTNNLNSKAQLDKVDTLDSEKQEEDPKNYTLKLLGAAFNLEAKDNMKRTVTFI